MVDCSHGTTAQLSDAGGWSTPYQLWELGGFQSQAPHRFSPPLHSFPSPTCGGSLHLHLVWKPHLSHSTGCIASPARGRVWSTCHTAFVSLHGEHSYFVCTSYEVQVNFVIASRLIKHYPAMPANIARSLLTHSRDTKKSMAC